MPQLRDLLGPNLRGVYVYGSLAFGCYNPARSDVDVLVVTRRRMAPATRREVSSFLNRLSAPLEISFFSHADLDPWRYPTPFDYHFSEEGESHDRADEFFATEIANARVRGVALVGPPAAEIFPEVPEEDFLDAIERDLAWARERVEERPAYGVLNACRVVAYRRERIIMSKRDAGEWGIRSAPEEFHALIADAAAFYAGDPAGELDHDAVLAFVDWARDA